MREPGKVGALSPKQALLLAVVFAVLGVGTVVLRAFSTGESPIVSLAVASGAFVAAVFMLVVWRIAKSRERNRSSSTQLD
jgi:phosphate/sulfate permease